ncbi:MAG: MlaD family protein [Rickettsiales bacterium]
MENEGHYFRVGLYILGLTLLLAAFAVWLTSSGHRDDVHYRMYFAESVSGLSIGSPVKYRGVTVGRVDTIDIDTQDARLIKVDLTISKSTPVKADTIGTLRTTGITGLVFVELTGGDPQAKNMVETMQDDKNIPVIRTESSSINAILTQLPVMLDKVSNFVTAMNKLTTDENIAQLSKTFENMQMITGDVRELLHGSKSSLANSVRELDGTLSNLHKASSDVSNVTGRVKDDPTTLIFPPDDKGVPAP